MFALQFESRKSTVCTFRGMIDMKTSTTRFLQIDGSLFSSLRQAQQTCTRCFPRLPPWSSTSWVSRPWTCATRSITSWSPTPAWPRWMARPRWGATSRSRWRRASAALSHLRSRWAQAGSSCLWYRLKVNVEIFWFKKPSDSSPFLFLYRIIHLCTSLSCVRHL